MSVKYPIESIGKFFFVGVFLVASYAMADKYDIDKSHSRVGFKISHLTISNVLGTFDDFSGSFLFDPDNVEKSETSVKIDVASVNTANKKRDDHLRNPDFFEVTKFPAMSFVSTKVQKKDSTHFTVMGNLTIRNETKAVALDVTYKGSVMDPWGNQRAGFMATTTLNRKDFGLTWNKTLDNGGLVVGDEVMIEIEVEGVKAKA
jgi:polyisoprenoid-binding protein YceI